MRTGFSQSVSAPLIRLLAGRTGKTPKRHTSAASARRCRIVSPRRSIVLQPDWR